MSKAFDAILASVPVNAAASRVTSPGAHYDPEIEIKTHPNAGVPMHSDVPLQCVAIPHQAKTNPNFIDMTGRAFGKMTVVGWLGKLSKNKNGFWLVRCACGNYEPRRIDKVKAASPNAACQKCIAWTNTKYRYETQGSRSIEDFV